MPARPDHNAASLTPEQATYTVYALKALRMLLKAVEATIRALDYSGADLTLALRHVEDARMRCGKAMEPFDTGFAQTDNPNETAVGAVNAVITSAQSAEDGKAYSVRAA